MTGSVSVESFVTPCGNEGVVAGGVTASPHIGRPYNASSDIAFSS